MRERKACICLKAEPQSKAASTIAPLSVSLGFPSGAGSKNPACQFRRHGFHPWIWKIPWRRAQQPTPVFLPGESHGQRSLAGCCPQGHTELKRLGMHARSVTAVRSVGKLKLGLSFLPRSGEWRIIYHETEGFVTLSSGVQSLEHHITWFCPEGL